MISKIIKTILRILFFPLLILSVYPLHVAHSVVFTKADHYEGVEDFYAGVWLVIVAVFAFIFMNSRKVIASSK